MGSPFIFAAVTAIAFVSPSSTRAENSGQIYVYAERLTAARSWLPISCDGAVVASLKRGTLFAINATPGRHTLSTVTGVPAFVEVRSDEKTFVRLDWNFEVGRSPIPVLSAVRPDQALKEMKYLSYIHAGRVFSGSVPKSDPREPDEPRLKSRGSAIMTR